MNYKLLIKEFLKKFLFKNYSTDIALRYLPVVEVIKKNRLEDSRILEVGSGDFGITVYLKRKITGIDVEFSGQGNGLVEKIEYNGNLFTFKNNEFDAVISVDALEHIAKEKRQNIINEILRTAKKAIILVVPCGKSAHKHDIKLSEYFYNIHKQQDKFLNEHVCNGLPEIDEMVVMINQAAEKLNKKINIAPVKKMLNLRIRYFIMKCKISKNFILSILYYLFLLFLPIRKFLNFGECYRCLFYVKVMPNLKQDLEASPIASD